MTVEEWGGRAMCPVDDYADPALREEMAWHALEQALEDAGRMDDARAMPLPEPVERLMPHVPPGGESGVIFFDLGLLAIWRATTDDHLGEDSSGLVDLTCTLTPA